MIPSSPQRRLGSRQPARRPDDASLRWHDGRGQRGRGPGMSTEIDYYELLECERTADDATLKSSYRKLAMKYHPGQERRLQGSSRPSSRRSAKPMRCLKDPQKRAAYDRFGHAAFKNGGGGGGGSRARPTSAASPTSSKASSASSWAAGAAAATAAAPRRRPALRHGDHARRGVPRQGDSEITVDVSAPATPARERGATPGTGNRACALCNGAGKVRSQQGSVRVRARLPRVQRRGAGHHRSVRQVPRRGPGRSAPRRWRSTCPPGSTRARASA